MKKEKLDKIALGTSEVKLSSFFDQESQQRINLKDMFKERPKLKNKHLNCINQNFTRKLLWITAFQMQNLPTFPSII